MGISYYAWAISHEEVTEAKDDPWAVIRRADQRYYDPGWANTGLDKAWPLMQRLFRPSGDQTRPGYELVAGDVTYPQGYEQGHRPHIGVLPRDRVPAIARDVESVRPADLRQFCASLRFDDEERRQQEHSYLAYHVKQAQTFTADAAARGHGIIYCIR